MLDCLAEGDITLFELRTRLIMEHAVDISRQAITKHLAILERAGLVTSVKAGRSKLLHLNPQPIQTIAARWISTYTT